MARGDWPVAKAAKTRRTTAASASSIFRAPGHQLAAGVEFAHNVIAEAEPTARPTLLNAAPQTSAGLGGEVLEEDRVHGALEPDMKLADLALGQGHQLDAGEAELLEKASDILLIPAQSVEGLGHDHVELTAPGVLQKLLVARPQATGA
jgi:hypothetical protein